MVILPSLNLDDISSIFLQQFDRFKLVDSRFVFLSPSATLARSIFPELMWLNQKNRHRAQGKLL